LYGFCRHFMVFVILLWANKGRQPPYGVCNSIMS
jgi:hypothetical protein